MPLTVGDCLGSFEILAHIGAGGMGEVYRARDTKLDRLVALKILPESFALDPDRFARFKREAQFLASLNHPNIAAIYGFEDSAALHALVLELVEGPTLAERIEQGPIPLEDALAIAKQIAVAIETAHEHGIVHRDLKPANIKLRADGTVKVLDFGLAKLAPPEVSGAGVRATVSPTMTNPGLTAAGVILGSAAYMSPEQAKGRAADKRSDVWAFGCVLYEMLTGRRAFAGDDVSDTLAAVLRAEPDWTALPSGMPPTVRTILEGCLKKEWNDRIHDISTPLFLLQRQPVVATGVKPAPASWERITWATALLAGLTIAVFTLARRDRAIVPLAMMHVELTTPPTIDPVSLAVSPDGRSIVFSAMSEGRSVLWLRSFDSGSMRVLDGTAFGSFPFWSPDSRSMAFFADGKLKRIDIETGSVRSLANAAIGRGGSWSSDGTILFTPVSQGPIFRIPADGGEPVAISKPDAPRQANHRFPYFLPDGRHFLYFARGTPEAQGVFVGDLAGGNRRLLDADSAAVYVLKSVLFVRQGRLFAQRFDPTTLTLAGDALPLADDVAVQVQTSAAPLSVSASGAVAYRRGVANTRRQMVLVDRSGQELRKIAEPDAFVNPMLSADGHRIAVQRQGVNTDVWFLDIARGIPSRFTFDPVINGFPIWSPDGNRVVFNSNRNGQFDLFIKSAAGGSDEVLLATPQLKAPGDWSHDGRFVLYRSLDSEMNWDLWALPLQGDRKPIALVRTRFEERDGQFGPDDRWIAYQSDQSGQFEIYIRRFPGPEGSEQVSKGGGTQVRWGPDGKELFYVALDGRLMAVPIRFEADGSAQAGVPIPLFGTHIGGALQGIFRQQYVVLPGGQQFLMNTLSEETTTTPITLLLNWTGADKGPR